MAAKPISTMRIKQIIRLYEQGEKIKAISRYTGVSRNTVRFYLRRLQELGLSTRLALEMEDPVLEQKFFDQAKSETRRRLQMQDLAEEYLEELKDRKVTRQLLWEEYRKDNPHGYSYTQFCHYLQQHRRIREAVLVGRHDPGEKMEVDFTGSKFHYLNPDTGEIVPCEVLVAVLNHSNYTFAIAVHSQKLDDVIPGCTAALEYYGGSPKAIVPDNLKAAVTRSHRYEPRINDIFLDMANHYGMSVVPTRPAKPRDKPKVEKGVSVVYQRVFAPLRKKVFSSLRDLNLAIGEQIEKLNDRMMQQYGCSRRELFEANEKHLLRKLPVSAYELRHHLVLTVQQNCHVYIARRKQYFSVPFELIGKKVQVVWSENAVSVYHNSQRVAFHTPQHKERYCTVAEHLPSHHQHYLAQKQGEELRQSAARLGPDVLAAIQLVLSRGQHPEQAYRTCQGILALARKTDANTLSKACRVALEYNVVSYREIHRLTTGQYANLEKKKPSAKLPDHENIRGKSLFD